MKILEIEYEHDGKGDAVFDIGLTAINESGGIASISINGKLYFLELDEGRTIYVKDCHVIVRGKVNDFGQE